MCVCVSARRIWMKFSLVVVLKGGKVLRFFYPIPQPHRYGVCKVGTSGASAMHFGENFIKQKLLGASYLVGDSKSRS